MLSHKARAVALAALSLFAGAAHAEAITFEFTGTVRYSRDAAFATVGAPITGTFTYDADTAPWNTREGYAAYQVTTYMSGTVNGHIIDSDLLNIDINDNYGGNVEDTVTISGGPIMIDDVVHLQGSFNISLASGPGETDVLLNTRLPTIYHLEAFGTDAAGQDLSYGSLHEHDGGLALVFTIDSITGGYESCTNPQGKPKKCKKPKK